MNIEKTDKLSQQLSLAPKTWYRELVYSPIVDKIDDIVLDIIISYLPFNVQLLINRRSYNSILLKLDAKRKIVNAYNDYIKYKKSLNIFIIAYLNRNALGADNMIDREISALINEDIDLNTLVILRNINVYYYYLRIYNRYRMLNDRLNRELDGVDNINEDRDQDNNVDSDSDSSSDSDHYNYNGEYASGSESDDSDDDI